VKHPEFSLSAQFDQGILMIAEEIGVSEGTVRTARKQSGFAGLRTCVGGLACRFRRRFLLLNCFFPLFSLLAAIVIARRATWQVDSEVVNGQKGLWVHRAGHRRQGRVRHISAVERPAWTACRWRQVTFDIVPKPRQGIGGKSAGEVRARLSGDSV